MKRTALSKKIMMIGMDGLDPRFSKRMVDLGKMPNLKKLIEKGACREDLVLLGGHPTDTPPMWTTLATGCNPHTHGVTGFYRSSDKGLDYIEYNLHSSYNLAEPLWNVTADAGLKTLVFHWPGSSWPPTSDNPNLMVIDGTQPGGVGMAVAQVDKEFIILANENVDELEFENDSQTDLVAPCIVENLSGEDNGDNDIQMDETSTSVLDTLAGPGASAMNNLVMQKSEQGLNYSEISADIVKSPIKTATGWVIDAEGLKEFGILYNKGLVRRVALILKNEQGLFDRIAIYKSKKETKPIVVLPIGEMKHQIVDEAKSPEGVTYQAVRSMKVLRLDSSGKSLELYISSALDTRNDSVWHPKKLYREVTETVGYPMPTSMLGKQEKKMITDCMLDVWYGQADWQSGAIKELIRQEELDVVFSHFHCVDIQEHMFIRHLSPKPGVTIYPHEHYLKFIEDVYILADYYIGKYLPLLDEGWTLIVFSDHGLVTSKHDTPELAETTGISIGIMRDLGYTVMKKDENGNDLREVDWSKTKAIAQREGHVYINLKGREANGIVDPKDKYELERQIIDDLYRYRDPETGKRVVSAVLRNKDAILLGMGGPLAGDIYYWIDEGFCYDHGDSLSTVQGECETSVSPIFVGCGPGFKEGYNTKRYIKEIDFAPTIAALAGVRFPADCEGAPMYQLLSEEI